MAAFPSQLRFPASRLRERRSYAHWGPRLAIAAVVAGLVLSQLFAYLLLEAGGGDDAAPAWLVGIALIGADLVILGIVLAAAKRGARRLGGATLGVRRTRLGPAIGWTFALLAAVLVIEGIYIAVVDPSRSGGFGPSGSGEASAATAFILFFVIAVGAPVVEELAFRGYLFPALADWRGPWFGAIVAGALFGFAHLGAYSIEMVPPLALFGFALCLLFWFTGSLLPCVAAHAINNGLVLSLGLGWTWQVPLGVLASVALSLFVLAPFAKERAPHAQSPTATPA